MIWDYGHIIPENLCDADVYYYRGADKHYKDVFGPYLDRLGLDYRDGDDYDWRTPTWHVERMYAGGLNYYGSLKFIEGQMLPGEDDVSRWHFDGTQWRYVALWSTNAPTEFKRLAQRKPRHLKPGHLMVMLNDRTTHHRTGRLGYDPHTRYFLRIGIPYKSSWTPDDSKLVKF